MTSLLFLSFPVHMYLKQLPRAGLSLHTSGIETFESLAFVKDLGRWIRKGTGEKASCLHLIQRLSVAVQIGNVAAKLGNCIHELLSVHIFCFIYFIAIYSY